MTECTHCRKRYENNVRFCPVDGYAVVAVAEPLLGRLLMGQFQIQSVCGHGATGTVYRATQTGIDREVAVKLLKADLLKDPDVIKRFVREARAGARLSHPNIATVHMVGQTDEGVPFLVMEYIEGVSLAAVLGVGKPMPLRRMVHIGAQIASAIGEAHGQSIVHRDLKPENILLTERRGEADVVKVVDFGIAKMIAHAAPGEDPISRMGTVFGTPHYIAPEQAAGQPVDGRADIYSLGCILFQMATGRVPFDGQQGLQVLLRQVRDPVPDPRTINPRIPDALAELILKMLAKEPSARPQNAALVATALRDLDSDPAPAAALPASGSPGRRADSPRSGAPAALEPPAKPAKDNSWYERDEAGDEPDERDSEAAADAGPRRRRRRRSAEIDRDTRQRRPARSGRPSVDSLPEDSSEDSEDRLPPSTFWQLYWRPALGVSSAIAIGAVAGLLYAHFHSPPPPPVTPPPVMLAAPPPAAPATNLIRSSSRGSSSSRPAPAALIVAPPTTAKTSEPSAPVVVFPAGGPPLTGPRPLGPGPAVAAPAPTTVAPPGTSVVPPAQATAPAPTPAPPAATAVTPPPAATPPPVIAAPPPVAAPPPPAAVPSPPPAPAATEKPASAEPPSAPPATAPAVTPPPPSRPAEEGEESSSDPYHRLK